MYEKIFIKLPDSNIKVAKENPLLIFFFSKNKIDRIHTTFANFEDQKTPIFSISEIEYIKNG